MPLPEAEREVKTLGRLYGRGSSTVLVRGEAREDRLKGLAGDFSVLHLATHGVLDSAAPLRSHVMLTPGPAGEDGMLEAEEIMDLSLRVDLVVLSACESGRGRIATGEGLIGLSWALFVAGTPTSVVSQWKVDSASTSALMVALHRQLRASPRVRQGGRPARRFAGAPREAGVPPPVLLGGLRDDGRRVLRRAARSSAYSTVKRCSSTGVDCTVTATSFETIGAPQSGVVRSTSR